jgi:RHH-type proline utilization regulon transcriptional repressor/proline dehydrogenase/delta 1-pyrroline-5-carboxylate dehydrogenase
MTVSNAHIPFISPLSEAFLMSDSNPPFPSWRTQLNQAYRADEAALVEDLLSECQLPETARQNITDRARTLVQAVRDNRIHKGGIDAFMHEYDLSTQEGLVLMCLAEALLRIPDAATADKLIRDKLSGTDWEKHLGHSPSIFVNASTIGLMMTGRILGPKDLPEDAPGGVMQRMIARLGEPVIREALRRAMRIMGKQFVLGRTIEEAMKRGADSVSRGYRYSFDMLGEAARTEEDALKYYKSYEKAIHSIGKAANGAGVEKGPGISVKLSALHPRYEPGKRADMLDVMVKRTLALAELAKSYDIGFCVDAEEAERLELSLEIIEAVYASPTLEGWTGFGLAIQAYAKRTRQVIDVLAGMVDRVGRRMNVRLVKGAYWDSEIKRSQELGLVDFPVYSRKVTTDVSYLACAQRLLNYGERFFPQFATHNAHSAATILELAQGRPFEFQRLHGMGEELYDEITPANKMNVPCRIYAPVGGHAELLSYLVRRLLENGANTSFVNRLVDDQTPIEAIIADPVERLAALPQKRHSGIALPKALYLDAEHKGRLNSAGIDLSDSVIHQDLRAEMDRHATTLPVAGPIINGVESTVRGEQQANPANRTQVVGSVVQATLADAQAALSAAEQGFPAWAAQPAEQRAACLERAADLLEADTAAMMDLCVREAGKTLPDAIAEVREAVDFLRYYAIQARHQAAEGLVGRGVFVCISPWNFPLAIFTGQVCAALVVGNTVVAKPAEQTPLIAAAMVRLFHKAGVPVEALHLIPGPGETVGAALTADPRVAGVAFTGSEAVAQIINRTLALRDQAIPLIAETGGLNAMIVDSSALPEQVIRDVVISAFGSAGQRCSALRVLFVQKDVADGTIAMLKGAMDELRLGDPRQLDTDVGPVIDNEALTTLTAHAARMDREAKLIHVTPAPETAALGTFFAPRAYEIDSIARLEREVFGPVLHVIRYAPGELDKVVAAIKATGYGLTMGIHTRIDAQARRIQAHSAIGNTYVNRSMIGAVVGVQPFGGEGLSGTGPKAGGPNYLPRYGRFVSAPLAVDGQAAHALAQESAKFMPADLPPASAANGLATPANAPRALSALDKRTRLLGRLKEALHDDGALLTALLCRDGEQTALDAAQNIVAAADGLAPLTLQVIKDTSGPMALPGPTGERNELSVAPRGTVALVAGDDANVASLVLRLAAALGGGNRVELVVSPAHAAALALLVAKAEIGNDLCTVQVADLDQRASFVSAPGLAAIAVEGTVPGLIRAAAARSGAILPLDAEPVSPYTLHRTLTERSLSWDMTAAGGNASLLTLNEDGPTA